MSWEAVGAIGEILGAIAVFVTLVYLATQIKQSNDLARFNASKELVNQFNELDRLVATDASLRRILAETGELSADEREQVYHFSIMFCNVWLSAQIAHDSNQIEESVYAACVQDVHVELARWPSFRPAAQEWLSSYPQNAHHPIFQPILQADDRAGSA